MSINAMAKLYVSSPTFDIDLVMGSLAELKTESMVVTTVSTVFRDDIYHIERGCCITFIDALPEDVVKWWVSAKKNLGFNCCHVKDQHGYEGCMQSWNPNFKCVQ
jgi:hypothetical protein